MVGYVECITSGHRAVSLIGLGQKVLRFSSELLRAKGLREGYAIVRIFSYQGCYTVCGREISISEAQSPGSGALDLNAS